MKCRIRKINALFIFFIILLLSFINNCYSQSFVLENNLKRDAISFIKVKNLIIVPIFINGKGPYNFLLDTGVNPLIITDPELIGNFSADSLRSFKIYGAGGGAEIDVFIADNVKVKIAKAVINNIPTVVLKEEIFNFSDYLGIKVHGILGYYFFNSFLVKINYQSKMLAFYSQNAKKKIKGNKIDLQFFENKPYIKTKITTTTLGEIEALLIVDSGASHALSLETYQMSPFPVPDVNINGNLGIGLSGIISGKIGRISSINLGKYSLKRILTNFPNYNDIAAKTNVKDRTGNIGSEILRRFHVIFDYQNSAMYLKRNSAFNEPFEHDMSGLEIFIKPGKINRFFVNRVEIGSQAEKGGFEVGDELLSINFKPINFSSLDEVTSLLKYDDQKTIIIELARKDNILIKSLKLKRRV